MAFCTSRISSSAGVVSVSYTHLDVYKRQDLQHPEDTAHARIYDRLIEMCSPVRFTGSNFRKATAQEKMGQLKKLMNRKESRL